MANVCCKKKRTNLIYIYIEAYWNIGKILEGNANRILSMKSQTHKDKSVKFEKTFVVSILVPATGRTGYQFQSVAHLLLSHLCN